MRTKLSAAACLLLSLSLIFSCKKEIKDKPITKDEQILSNPSGGNGSEDQPCIEELDPDWFPDSILTPTILGQRLLGSPYSVTNMQQASMNLYGNANGIAVTKWYVRFRPADENQVQLLSESGIDVFDYPLDREVLVDGDYFPQEGIGENEIPYYYAVVTPGYQPPFGLHYELLQELYVPDQNILLEDEALRITGNPVDDTCNNIYYKEIVPCEADPCGPGCPILEPNPCSGGGGGGGGTTTDPRRPAGNISVTDNSVHSNVPVKRVRVVCKRYFKVDPVYTDDHGHFQSNKRFKNKVNIIVKFLNNNTIVSGLRGSKVWQMHFPIKKGIGIYSGPLNNITYVFQDATSQPNSRRNRNWWACHFINSRLEYNDMASQQQIGNTPDFLRVLLSGWASTRGTGSTPMNGHRLSAGSTPSIFIDVFLVNPITAFRAQVNNAILNGIFIKRLDLTFGFDFAYLTISDNVKELIFHELTHSAHYNKVGNDWWNDFVYAEVYESARFGVNGAETPYGVNDDGQMSDQISLGESWAEHVGRWMTDNWYHASSTNQVNQGILYRNGDLVDGGFIFVTGLDAHLNLLEDFSPVRTVDVFRWIPYGLYYDMMDNRNDVLFSRVLLDDQVSNYTNQQFFNALESDIRS